jgi:glycosyltransferase involved in cell wall biosynthesis
LWKTPQNRFGNQISAYIANYLTDLTETGNAEKIDAIISLRYPSYAVRHQRHICWLNHRMREYYDLWDNFKANLSFGNLIKENIRRFIIHRIDNYLLKHNVKKLYAQSKNIQWRLQKWGRLESEVLYPPAIERGYKFVNYGDFILVPARLVRLKRIDLAIKAMYYVKSNKLSLIIVGDGPEEEKLHNLAEDLKIENRVKFVGRVSAEELIDLYSKCLAVFYGPFNEDYGLVVLEAFSSKKPLITCKDSGGATELVENNKNGLIVEPEETKIAEAFDFISDKTAAERLGNNGYLLSKEFSWEKVIKELLSCV